MVETIVVRTSMLAATIATATEDRVASNPPTDNGLKSFANGDDTDDLMDYLYEVEDGLGELVRTLRALRALHAYIRCLYTYIRCVHTYMFCAVCTYVCACASGRTMYV